MFDTVIRNGMVFDGTGAPGRVADVGIRDGQIVAVAPGLAGDAARVVDASGCIVTPGFVDAHTHYDGQATWSESLAPSPLHGVTTVVAANCGVGFAPCRASDHDALIAAMEGVEDIPGVVMAEGLDWSWESFPEFLDAVESRPHDIDVGFFLPHSPLRVFVMGERAVRLETASPSDLDAMAEIAREAVAAGALGFSTSRLDSHRDSAGNFIPSHNAEETELVRIMQGAREGGEAVFQMVPEVRHPDEQSILDEMAMVGRISREADCTATFTLVQNSVQPNGWRRMLEGVEKANAEGGRLKPQVFPRPVGMLYGLRATLNPFSLCPEFAPLEKLPLAERVAEMRKPEVRARLLADSPGDPSVPLVRFTRMWERIYPFDGANYAPKSSIAELARQQGRKPEEVAYDLLLEDDGRALLIATIANYQDGDLKAVFEMLQHPDTVVGLGDGGAHYGMICDASYSTFLLTWWTRDSDQGRMELAEAVRKLTSQPAALVGLADRGKIAPGYKADINVIDYDRLGLKLPDSLYDLPSGGHRFMQRSTGYRLTMVSGVPIVEDGVLTGATPGKLVRGVQSAPARVPEPA